MSEVKRTHSFVFEYPDGYSLDVRTAPLCYIQGRHRSRPSEGAVVAVPECDNPALWGESFRDHLYRDLCRAWAYKDMVELEALRQRVAWCEKKIAEDKEDA